MAKKIKALELNQSMFDRYVEALNARYSDRFEDVARDVSDVESRAANATAEARAAAAAAAAAADECDATVRAAARRHSGDAAAADERVRALRAELDATRRAWRITFGVGLLVVAGLAALLAAASAAHAVAVSGKRGGYASRGDVSRGHYLFVPGRRRGRLRSRGYYLFGRRREKSSRRRRQGARRGGGVGGVGERRRRRRRMLDPLRTDRRRRREIRVGHRGTGDARRLARRRESRVNKPKIGIRDVNPT